jgi:hypothetical protein
MRRLLIVCATGLALTGCGVLDEQGPAAPKPLDPAVFGPSSVSGPSQPSVPVPPLVAPAGELARKLDGGAIGVVDPGGIVSIEPSRLETASDVSLDGLRWTSWGPGGAEASGQIHMLTCNPTCASGGSDQAPARLKLSGLKTCDGRRYFDHGEVLIDPKDTPTGAPPATYLRAPC